MRKGFLASLVAIFSVFSSLHAEDFDAGADAQILACANSKGFSHAKIDYRFGMYVYRIYMLHNPDRELLWVEEFGDADNWPLAIMANLPFELIGHLEDLIPALQRHDEELYVDLRGFEEVSPELFGALRPVSVATQIEDSKTDAEIKELFTSTDFVNKVFHYCLNGQQYKVRILHNPLGKTLTAVREYRLEAGEKLRGFSISWSDRYGILVDKPAPQALIDHLCSLTNSGWWDWYFKFKVENGTHVTYTRNSYNYITTYYLDPWFDYTSDLH